MNRSITICKSDSLGLAKPQGEGCQDQSTSEDISASARVPASKKMKKCPTSEMKPCASAVNGTFHPSASLQTTLHNCLIKDCTQLRYQMGTRLDSITTDNGANFKAAVQILLNEDITEENPACACHTFSLVVKKFYRPMQKEGVLVLINVTYNYTLSSCRFLIMTLDHCAN